MAYGSTQIMTEGLKIIDFMVKTTDKGLVKNVILKIIGPILRVTNYQLTQNQKLTLLDFIHRMNVLGFNLEPYHHQILSVTFRVLLELRSNKEAPKLCCVNLLDLL